MNELITKTTSMDLAVIPNNGLGFDSEIEKEPIIFPYYKIGHKKDVAGKIFDSMGNVYDSVNACIGKITTARSLWKKPYNPNEKIPLCRSFDNKVPDTELFKSGKSSLKPPAETCIECINSKTIDDSGNWQRPACDLQYVLWGINIDTMTPFILQLSGLSLSKMSQTKGYMTIKQFISTCKIRGLQHMPYMLKTEIGVGKAKGQNGLDAYVAIFRILNEFEKSELETMARCLSDLSRVNSKVLASAEDIEEPEMSDTFEDEALELSDAQILELKELSESLGLKAEQIQGWCSKTFGVEFPRDLSQYDRLKIRLQLEIAKNKWQKFVAEQPTDAGFLLKVFEEKNQRQPKTLEDFLWFLKEAELLKKQSEEPPLNNNGDEIPF